MNRSERFGENHKSHDYDAVGNRIYESNNGIETYFTYDAANELTQAYNATDDSTTSYMYDAMGNCLSIADADGTTYFTYNDANLVTSITYPDSTVNYFYYDGLMRRYAMEDSAGLTYFVWDKGGLNLLAEKDASGNVTAEYIHGYSPVTGIGSLVAAKKTVDGTAYYQYPQYDHRGTVVGLTDKTGAVIASYEYNAFGEPLVAEESTDVQAAGNRFRYQSNWMTLKDSGDRFYLSAARVYDAKTGRFLQRDPLFSGQFLAHSFTFTNSVNFMFSEYSINDKKHLAPAFEIVEKLKQQTQRDNRPVKASKYIYNKHNANNRDYALAYALKLPVLCNDPYGLQTECKYCGRDVTGELTQEIINASQEWSNMFSEAATSWSSIWLYRMVTRWKDMASRGPTLDYLAASYKISKDGIICPSGKECERTYEICGECVHDHFIGNIMYGYWMRLHGFKDITTNAMAHGYQLVGPSDDGSYSGSFQLDLPYDQAGYELARKIFDSGLPSESTICGIIKGPEFTRANATGKDISMCQKCPI